MIIGFVWLMCGFIAGAVSGNRGQSRIAGFIIGLMFGPLGILLAAVQSPGCKCPYCKKGIDKEARLCPFCRSSVTPQSEARAAKRAVKKALRQAVTS